MTTTVSTWEWATSSSLSTWSNHLGGRQARSGFSMQTLSIDFNKWVGRQSGPVIKDKMANTLKTFVLVMLASVPVGVAQAAVYQDPADFVSESFHGNPPAPKVLWLTPEMRQEVEAVLGHAPNGMRVRYWQERTQTVWVMDEIGKELPITTGIVVNDGAIDRVRVLIFRESRGWEVRHDFFTRQFEGASMLEDGRLNRQIDGISGATLSVRAVEKLARVALLLDPRVNNN